MTGPVQAFAARCAECGRRLPPEVGPADCPGCQADREEAARRTALRRAMRLARERLGLRPEARARNHAWWALVAAVESQDWCVRLAPEADADRYRRAGQLARRALAELRAVRGDPV